VYFLVVAALASLALLGHAAGAAGAGGTADRLALGVHLLAAGAWVGALPALWVLAGRLGAADLAKVLRHFSRYGMALVAIVVLTGLFSAWRRTGAWSALVETGYGQLLLLKIALVGLMGVAALLNRNAHTPRLSQADIGIAAAARTGLRRSIGVELALGMAVIAVAAFLGAAEAPR
jgi:putative copper resistance protein D